MPMDLNERKRKILQAIIDEYIGTAEPVGSRTIAKLADMSISSATIRNEMADLEEMGYLMQPHTSAGRIPSDEGYRFYVDSLMSRYRLGMEAIENLHLELEKRVNQLDKVLDNGDNILTSKCTDIRINTKVELLVDTETTHIAQVVTLVREEELVDNITSSCIIRSLGSTQLTIDVTNSINL